MTALDRALDRAAGARLIPGNSVRHLTDGPEVYSAMLAMIEAASRWIHFENYIIASDATGEIFADALIRAAKRGVRVRVLYDAFGSRGTRRSYWSVLRSAGIEARAFNRINPMRPLRSLRRDHRKLVSVDGLTAVVGGVCIGDEWAGSAEKRREPWRDTAVEVAGAAVPAIEVTFERLWREAGGDAAIDAGLRSDPQGDANVRVVEGTPGWLRLYRAIALLAAVAADRIWITDAYLVAPSPLFHGLIAAARDGVDVRVLVPGKTDVPWVRTLTRVGYRELLDAGARIWEWHGPMLHAKTAIVDDHWFKVGSSNLNPSSLFSNHELDLVVEDGAVVAQAIQQFRRDLAYAVEIVQRPRRVPEALAGRLPPALVPAAPVERHHPRTARELSRRAAITVRQIAGGARRTITGAVFFVTVGVGVLLVALPRIMAYTLAVISFWLSLGAAMQFFRRRYRGD